MNTKIIASTLLALMALSPLGIAATQLGQFPAFLAEKVGPTSSLNALVVVGQDAAVSDVVAAIDLAARMAEVSYVEQAAAAAPGAVTLTGGVSLDTADSKIYLTENINKVKQILTSTDLPTLLAAGSVQEKSGEKIDYNQYIKIGAKTISYEQPDVASGLKDPAYLIRLGTSASPSAYLLETWVSFNKPFNATNAVGEELTLFGRTFTIAGETSGSRLVVYGLAGKETINAGETKTITVGGESYEVTVVGIIDSSSAVLKVNGVQKEVIEGKTYDFAGVSVYVESVFYYKVPVETGSVTVSIGADRYILDDSLHQISHGPEGSEEVIKGAYVDLDGTVDALNNIYIYFDAYTATPSVDYIKAGEAWTDPVFGIKVAYNGPAPATTEDIVIQPGATTYYTITFTDKYGKTGTIAWVYDSDPATAGGETLADSEGNAIHVVENETAGVGEYIFATASGFPHLLKVVTLDTTATPYKVTFRDVFSGTEYETTSTTTTATLVIDGQQYNVTFDTTNKKVSLADSESGTVVYPVLETKYGAKIAFFAPLTGKSLTGTLKLPTGSYTITGDQNTTYNITTVGNLVFEVTESSTATNTITDISKVYANGVAVDKPAIILIEEKTKAGNQDAIIIPIEDDATTDKRLEVGTLAYTHDLGDIYSDVATSSTTVTHTVTEWGTKLVIDKTAAGTVTITYPDTQVYHLAAVGENPTWTTGAATQGGTFKVVAPITTPIAKLDTEVTDADKAAYNLVLVGGPAINRLTAEVWGLAYPTYGAASGIPEGKAVIQVIDDAFASGKVVLVVAGWGAEQTRLAADLLMAGKLAGQTASKVIVSGTLTAPVIEAA